MDSFRMMQPRTLEKCRILKFEETLEGDSAEFSVQLIPETLDEFASLSGDYNPLHMDAEFAQRRGFENRVSHGLLLGSYVSRLVGMMLPGQNAIIHQVQMTFHAPVLCTNKIRVAGLVSRKIESVKTIVLTFEISKCETSGTEEKVASGKVQIGFTE